MNQNTEGKAIITNVGLTSFTTVKHYQDIIYEDQILLKVKLHRFVIFHS